MPIMPAMQDTGYSLGASMGKHGKQIVVDSRQPQTNNATRVHWCQVQGRTLGHDLRWQPTILLPHTNAPAYSSPLVHANAAIQDGHTCGAVVVSSVCVRAVPARRDC